MVIFSIYFGGRADGLDVWFKKMRGIKNISKILGLKNLKSGVITPKMEKDCSRFMDVENQAMSSRHLDIQVLASCERLRLEW